MSAIRQTDTILDGLRTVIGTSVIVASASLAVRQTPETDLLLMPEVSSTNYPLVALQVVEDEPGVAPERETAKQQSVGVTVAVHAVARYEDVDSHPSLATPNELCRKFSQAIDVLIGATPQLSTDIVGRGMWLGAGQEIASKDELAGQGLCAYSSVWRFDYGIDRT
jgi:hypothetical protein